MSGGFDEQPQRTIAVDTFSIDRYEVTNFQYQQFVAATGHRKAAPPSRYAKNIGKMRGTNQPVVYVSWEDADELLPLERQAASHRSRVGEGHARHRRPAVAMG